MARSIRIVGVALVAAVLTVGLGVTSAPAADLPPSSCVLTGITPNRATAGIVSTYATFEPVVTGCALGSWKIVIPSFEYVDQGRPKAGAGHSDDQHPQMYLNPQYLHDDWVGLLPQGSHAEVFAVGESAATQLPATGDFPFTLQKQTVIRGIDAGAPSIVRGQSATVVGRLLRARWNGADAVHLKYMPYPKATVALQYRATDASAYTTDRTISADSRGRLRAMVKPVVTARWRYSFAGNSTTAAVSSPSTRLRVYLHAPD